MVNRSPDVPQSLWKLHHLLSSPFLCPPTVLPHTRQHPQGVLQRSIDRCVSPSCVLRLNISEAFSIMNEIISEWSGGDKAPGLALEHSPPSFLGPPGFSWPCSASFSSWPMIGEARGHLETTPESQNIDTKHHLNPMKQEKSMSFFL